VLRRRGWDVRLCLPLYRPLIQHPLGPPVVECDVPSPGRYHVTVRQAVGQPGSVPTYFVDCPPLFERPGIYTEDGAGYDDNPLRFAVFQLGARALAETLGPTILHCHDWHAALLPSLLHLRSGRRPRLAETRTILTVHNLQYQGECDRSLLSELGLPRALWHPAWAEHYGKLNALKAGILSADRVTTVSPTYANEIRTPAGGLGLDGPLRERGNDLRAILNGIDEAGADPANDPELPAHYSLRDTRGRTKCKAALRHELGLPGTADEPIVAYVGRMTAEKGVDLLAEALPEIAALGARAVALGAGDRPIEGALSERERELGDRFRAVLRYDNKLVRRIYAGADILVVPSRVEPCGLVQLYALRYGAVPVVHAVGGLRDTVRDGETGFLFHEPTAAALLGGVRRALAQYRQRSKWITVRAAGMAQDWSWGQSAAAYEALYREVLATPPLRRPPPPLEEAPQPPADWGPGLPATLGRPALRLLAQGPKCLYAYWEQDVPAPLVLELEEQPTGVCYQVSDDRAGTGEQWFAASPEHAYRAVLRRPDGQMVAVSNAVLTPRDVLASDDDLPAWLARALFVELFEDRAGDKWPDVFAAPPRVVRGAPPVDWTLVESHTAPSSGSAFLIRPHGVEP
jgi:starch synthase